MTSDFLVGNRECNTERGFKNQLYIELGSPSEDVKFSNVRGLYLRKYGTFSMISNSRIVRGHLCFLCTLTNRRDYKFDSRRQGECALCISFL